MIVRLHFPQLLNSCISRDHLKASLTLLLLNPPFRDTRYSLSIKWARRPCRYLPPIRAECQACLRKISNTTLVLHQYSKHGSQGHSSLYKSRHRHPI